MEIDSSLLTAMIGVVGKKKTDEILLLAIQIKNESKYRKPHDAKPGKYKNMRRII